MTRLEHVCNDMPADPAARGKYALRLGFMPIELGSGYVARSPIPGYNEHGRESFKKEWQAAKEQLEWFLSYWTGL